MSAVQVLLVDDSPDFLQIASGFLVRDPALEIVATATSGERALELADAFHPDLVIMDLAMPGIGGLEATRRLKARPNPPVVIVLTLYDEEAYFVQARHAGADEVVAKSDLGVALLPLIRRMFDGQALQSSEDREEKF